MAGIILNGSVIKGLILNGSPVIAMLNGVKVFPMEEPVDLGRDTTAGAAELAQIPSDWK